MSVGEKIAMIDTGDKLSIREQCKLVHLNRGNLYYQASEEFPENLHLMRLMDEEYTRHPFKMEAYLRELGFEVNNKRVRRLLRVMRLSVIYPKRSLSQSNKAQIKYPYLLKDLAITASNQVWCSDITYIRLVQ